MTNTGEKLIKSAKQAAAMARGEACDTNISNAALVKRLRDRGLRLEMKSDELVLSATWLANTAADRIQELEAQLATSASIPECIQARDKTIELLESELSGVHAGTHCIVPYEFIELAADPVGVDECRELEHYIDTIETWADRVRRKAEPFLCAMLTESKET